MQNSHPVQGSVQKPYAATDGCPKNAWMPLVTGRSVSSFYCHSGYLHSSGLPPWEVATHSLLIHYLAACLCRFPRKEFLLSLGDLDKEAVTQRSRERLRTQVSSCPGLNKDRGEGDPVPSSCQAGRPPGVSSIFLFSASCKVYDLPFPPAHFSHP